MAALEFTIRRGMCSLGLKEYHGQCHTSCAEDMGCRYFDNGDGSTRVVPFGDCCNAKYAYIEKGVSTKNYQVEVFRDDYNNDEWAVVTIGRKEYECVRVKIDGEIIYPKMED